MPISIFIFFYSNNLSPIEYISSTILNPRTSRSQVNIAYPNLVSHYTLIKLHFKRYASTFLLESSLL